jgi:hypothetical protein
VSVLRFHLGSDFGDMGKTVNRVIAQLCVYAALVGSCFGACTATHSHGGGGTDNGSATSATVSATIGAVGNLVIIPVWCYASCTLGSVTLGSQAATQIGTTAAADANAGQPTIFYILSANTSGTLTITANVSGTHSDVQVGYHDFTPSAGCTFSHNVDSGYGTGSGTTVNTPSITATVGDVEFMFTAVSSAVSTINAPWTQGASYTTSANADGYILSASGSATANNVTMSSGSWRALGTSFAMSTGGGGGGGSTCNNSIPLMGVGCK